MDLQQAKDRFLGDLVRRSPNTVRAYDLAIRQLLDVTGPSLDVADLTPELALAAVRRAKVRSVSRNTLASYMSGIKLFLRWLVLERLVSFDLIDLENLATQFKDLTGREPNRLPHVPTDDSVHAILDAARAFEPTSDRLAILAARDIAILETLRTTGARVGEVVSLKCRDPTCKTALPW